MLLRIGSVAFVAALSDAKAALESMAKVLSKAKRMGALSRRELREILAYLAYYDLPLSRGRNFAPALSTIASQFWWIIRNGYSTRKDIPVLAI